MPKGLPKLPAYFRRGARKGGVVILRAARKAGVVILRGARMACGKQEWSKGVVVRALERC